MEGTNFSSIALDQIKPLLSNLGSKSLRELEVLVKRQIELTHAQEIADARQKIADIAAQVNLTPQQIIWAHKAAVVIGEPAFRDPRNPGQAWSGRGPQPHWFKEALNNGYTREQLRAA